MPILDFHTHVGVSYEYLGRVYSQSIEELEAEMLTSGVTHSVVFPFSERGSDVDTGVLTIASKALADRISGKSHLIPFLRFDPSAMKPDSLEKMLPYFKGVKLHPRGQNFDPLDEQFFSLYEVIQSQDKPLLFHSKRTEGPTVDPTRLSYLSSNFSSIDLVLGHFGQYGYRVPEDVARNERIYLETSLISSRTALEEVGKQIDFHRILFSSDAPFSDQQTQLGHVVRSHLTDGQKESVLYNNATRLLKLS